MIATASKILKHLEKVSLVGRPDSSSVIEDDNCLVCTQDYVEVFDMLHSAVCLRTSLI